MKAVLIEKPGGPEVLKIGDAPDPVCGPADLLIEVKYAGLNRADTMQRMGLYPPPPGASEIPGLECAGIVCEVGANVDGWKVGERAMALLAGGGYAEKVAVHFGSAMHVPAAVTDEEAGGIPEVYLTAYLNLFMLGGIALGETALIHGGGGGVGTAAIQLLHEAGLRCIVTAGSAQKCEQCSRLGADVAINYREGPFAPKVKEATAGKGADVILDCVGAGYLGENLEALATNGRLVIIGLMKGARSTIDLGGLLRRRQSIIGSALRVRHVQEKARIVRSFLDRFGAALEARRIRCIVHRILPLAEAAEAHRIMEASEQFGKILLRTAV